MNILAGDEGDDSVFDEHWMAAVENDGTFREQQRKEGVGPIRSCV